MNEEQQRALAGLETISDQLAARLAARFGLPDPSDPVAQQQAAWAQWQAQQAAQQAMWAQWQAQQAQQTAQDDPALALVLALRKKTEAVAWPGNAALDYTIVKGAGVDTGTAAFDAPYTGTVNSRRRFGVTLTPAGTPATGVQATITFPASVQLALAGREPPVIRATPLTQSGAVVPVPVLNAVTGAVEGFTLNAPIALATSAHTYLVTIEG